MRAGGAGSAAASDAFAGLTKDTPLKDWRFGGHEIRPTRKGPVQMSVHEAEAMR